MNAARRSLGNRKTFGYAAVAHLVERHLAKVEVAGSSPVIRSNKRVRKHFRTRFSKKRGSNEKRAGTSGDEEHGAIAKR